MAVCRVRVVVEEIFQKKFQKSNSKFQKTNSKKQIRNSKDKPGPVLEFGI
jgi:hypothetical protein